MQTPTGSTNEVVQPVEWNMWAAALADLASWWVDVYASTNVVQPGGGTLTPQAGPPIVVNYASFVCTINGPARTARFFVPGGSVTLAAADPSHGRVDLVVGTASQTTPNDSAGNATALDVLTVTKVTGVASGSPVPPALPANSVQLGTVLVPANATSGATCTITQALGPLSPKNLQDLTNHIAASMASASVHGFQATAPGGLGYNRLAQTDGTYGGVGGLVPGAPMFIGNGGSYLTLTSNAGEVGGAFLELISVAGDNQVNISGNATAALALLKFYATIVEITGALHVDGALTVGGAAVATLDGNGAVAKAEQLVSAGVTITMDRGTVSGSYGGNLTASGTVTFATNFGGRSPTVVATIVSSPAGTYPQITSTSATGFGWLMNAGTGLGNTSFNWVAVG